MKPRLEYFRGSTIDPKMVPVSNENENAAVSLVEYGERARIFTDAKNWLEFIPDGEMSNVIWCRSGAKVQTATISRDVAANIARAGWNSDVDFLERYGWHEVVESAPNDAERENWNFVPIARQGLPLKQMSEDQKEIAAGRACNECPREPLTSVQDFQPLEPSAGTAPNDEPVVSGQDFENLEASAGAGAVVELGFIYILVSSGLPGILKIGFTRRSPDERAAELSAATGVPMPFVVAYYAQCPYADRAEAELHSVLERFRVNDDREFFRIDVREAIAAVEEVCSRFTATYQNQSETTTGENPGEREDRLILEATQVVMSTGKVWPSLLTGHLKISLSEAEHVIAMLRGRGVVNSAWDIAGYSAAEYHRRRQEEKRKATAAVLAERREKEATARRWREAIERSTKYSPYVAGFAPPITTNTQSVAAERQASNMSVGPARQSTIGSRTPISYVHVRTKIQRTPGEWFWWVVGWSLFWFMMAGIVVGAFQNIGRH